MVILLVARSLSISFSFRFHNGQVHAVVAIELDFHIASKIIKQWVWHKLVRAGAISIFLPPELPFLLLGRSIGALGYHPNRYCRGGQIRRWAWCLFP